MKKHRNKNEWVREKKTSDKAPPFEDDRYPGSFFRVPGIPRPGKTTWRVS